MQKIMDDVRYSKHNMCDGKASHHTSNDALREIKAMKKDKAFMKPYECLYCEKWHIGHIIKVNL